jgi:uncharacterized protein
MKKVANFLVEKRYIVLVSMIIITVVCGLLINKVTVNTDMSKYLPTNSSMKAGLGIMNKEFPVNEASGDVRVMFNGLNDSQKAKILEKLKAIKYVDTVDFKAGSSDYNKGERSLYIVNFKYGYSSSEAVAVANAISNGFKDYDMVYHIDNVKSSLSPFIIFSALAILTIILLLMCHSWLEPILLLVTIGLAVVINMGTNVFLGSISENTKSISSILQLVLSMDYAMVLLNRYRQELALNSNAKIAMKSALAKAFHAIVSSALATMVGLLTLCFMSFKIGMDLGLVLSKGVFFSMICITTVLPALIVMFDKGIKKSTKKVLPIKMDAISKFSNKFRFVITGVFVIIFVCVFLLSNNTKIAYVLSGGDPTAKYFPKDSQVVILYKNSDEAAAAKMADKYSSNPNVKVLNSYSSTLGKSYTAKELASVLAQSSGSGMKIDPSMLKIIYYSYYKGDKASSLSAREFMKISMTESDPSWKLSIKDLFTQLSNSILKDSRFDALINADMRVKISAMKTKLDMGEKQLVGPNYSRMILTVSLQDGSDQSNAFIKELSQTCKKSFSRDHYLIGSSPMVYEMSQSFGSEHNFITLLIVIAIFVVVAVTFRSFLIPLILVLVIQGGVYLTISLIGLQGDNIYYLALLIVECILMGATIDYGILFASYYKESRVSMGRSEALKAALDGSIHTILTSGLIMIFVTGIVGFAFKDPSAAMVCQTIAKGAFFAVILTVFVLPGVTATFDKLINRGKRVHL